VSKYGNRKSGGFASGREHKRITDLRLLEKVGAITDLKLQVKYVLLPKQGKERPVTYTADATYMEDGKFICEDVKGFKTQQYVIRRKLMLFIHGIEIRET
jgi:hypothetical protein